MKIIIRSINLKNLLLTLFAGICMLSCKTVSVQNSQQKLTEYPVALGSIGEDKNFIIQKDYTTTAYPKYIKPIKIIAQAVPFSKATFHAFEKANMLQSPKLQLNFSDSLKIKPHYVSLTIADRVGVLNSVKNKANQDVLAYIKDKENTHLVTHISLVLKENVIAEIQNANEVFLSTSGLKNYVLHLYKNKKLVKKIHFNEGVIFSYKTSNFCWKQDDKYKVQIIDLVESSKRCPKKSYRSAKHANKKVNYYNF